MTDEILTSATEASLSLHIPIYTMESGAEQQTVTTRSLYLLSPTGTRYKLLDLPENPLIVNQLTHWKAGEIRALVSTFTQDGDNDYAWLDLRTGELTPTAPR